MDLNNKSLLKLSRIHPELQRVIQRAAEITDIDFIVTCGERTHTEQEQLVKKGASKTMRSRHLPESNACRMSCAVDLAVMKDGSITWDYEHYTALSKIVKQAAQDVDVQIEWGGDWKSFKDGPHYQLPVSVEPYAQK